MYYSFIRLRSTTKSDQSFIPYKTSTPQMWDLDPNLLNILVSPWSGKIIEVVARLSAPALGSFVHVYRCPMRPWSRFLSALSWFFHLNQQPEWIIDRPNQIRISGPKNTYHAIHFQYSYIRPHVNFNKYNLKLVGIATNYIYHVHTIFHSWAW
jgi:hypothetical protein